MELNKESLKIPAVKLDKELTEYNRLYKELEKLYHEIALKTGLSDSAFLVLYTICEIGDGCSQTEICTQVSISKQTINSCIGKLEKQGYISMAQGKGRTLPIHLTEYGRRFVQKKIYPVIQMEHQVFKKLEKKERQELLRLSRKYVDIFREESLLLLTSEERL